MNGIHAALTGKMVSEPQQRFTGTGKAMLSFSVLVDQSFTATEDRPAPEGIFVRVTAWQETAELLVSALHKGSLVYAEGSLKHATWQTTEGEPRLPDTLHLCRRPWPAPWGGEVREPVHLARKRGAPEVPRTTRANPPPMLPLLISAVGGNPGCQEPRPYWRHKRTEFMSLHQDR